MHQKGIITLSHDNNNSEFEESMRLSKEVLLMIARGEYVDELPENMQCIEEFTQLNIFYKDLHHFVKALIDGDFEKEFPHSGVLADSLKALQTNLFYLNWQTKKIAEGDLSHRINFMGDFSTAFNTMVDNLADARKQLNDKNKGLEELNKELNKDLQLAADAQIATLKFQDNCSFLESKVIFKPFGIVSGDFYDGSVDESGNFNMFVGDATGHGTSAALLTMMFKMAMNSLSSHITTDEIMRQLNTQFADCMPDNKFITGIALKISPMGELKSSNAGHPSLIIVSSSGDEPIIVNESGLALGMFEDEIVEYTEFEYKLRTGDRFYVPTDGITEALYKGEQLGIKRLAKLLFEARGLSLSDGIDKLISKVDIEAEEKGYDDDVTLIGVEFLW